MSKSNINNRGYNKYLKIKGNVDIEIDYKKYQDDTKWDGIKSFETNTGLPAKKVIENYANLWFIERAFRMNKTDLKIRPIYHRLRNRIEAHICISFTAYTILLELERMLKKSGSQITLKQTEDLTKRMYQKNNATFFGKSQALSAKHGRTATGTPRTNPQKFLRCPIGENRATCQQ